MKFPCQERRQVVVLEQKCHVARNDPASATRPHRRPRVDLQIDCQFLRRHRRQARVVQDSGQAHPAYMHRLAVIPRHLGFEAGEREIPFDLGHPILSGEAFGGDQREAMSSENRDRLMQPWAGLFRRFVLLARSPPPGGHRLPANSSTTGHRSRNTEPTATPCRRRFPFVRARCR